jgi:tetratricopeptide (TPR) repeat protein
VRDLVKAFRLPPLPLALGTSAALLACGLVTFRQVRVWQDSFTLFSHAERVTPPNIVTLNNLIVELLARGRVAEADARIDTALRLFPREYLAWWQAGNRARRRGEFGEAAAHYQTALRLQPREPQLHFLLALIFEQQQDKSEAIRHYREAIRLNPQFTLALNNLAWLLATHPDTRLRNGPEAVQFAERACELTHNTPTSWAHSPPPTPKSVNSSWPQLRPKKPSRSPKPDQTIPTLSAPAKRWPSTATSSRGMPRPHSPYHLLARLARAPYLFLPHRS